MIYPMYIGYSIAKNMLQKEAGIQKLQYAEYSLNQLRTIMTMNCATSEVLNGASAHVSNEDKGDLVLPVTQSGEIDIDKLLEQQMTPSIDTNAPITIEEIKNMISQLSVTEDGEPLKDAMARLKKGIKDNPEACNALLPEEIGEMVKALYKMTDRDLEIATEKINKKNKKKEKIDLSSKEIQQEILDDL